MFFLVCRYQKPVCLYSYAVAYISPRLPDTIRLAILVKGEEGVASVYVVKWQ